MRAGSDHVSARLLWGSAHSSALPTKALPSGEAQRHVGLVIPLGRHCLVFRSPLLFPENGTDYREVAVQITAGGMESFCMRQIWSKGCERNNGRAAMTKFFGRSATDDRLKRRTTKTCRMRLRGERMWGRGLGWGWGNAVWWDIYFAKRTARAAETPFEDSAAGMTATFKHISYCILHIAYCN